MAGFGIGMNNERPEAGNLKGERKEIACSCYFSCSGKTFPIMIRVEDEDGEIRTNTGAFTGKEKLCWNSG